ncbi:MAG: RDD family protein [Planctomycetes bacterium]|nr:RDD family protein [Planctomycetota bacterium]MCA8946565.1 RDD family protein [Planctomycetota bacterium]
MAGGQTPDGNPHQPQGPRPQQSNNPPWEQNNRPQQGGYPPQGGYQPQQGGYPQQQPQSPQYPPQGQYQPYGQSYAPQPQWQGGPPPPAYLPTEAFGGFWIRFVAYLIDAVILVIPNLIIGVIVATAMGVEPFAANFNTNPGMIDPQQQMASNISNLIQIMVGWGYFAVMTSQKGGSVGKLALGLRVVDDEGMYPGFGRASGRYFAKILSACLCAIGYIMAGFHEKKRGLHDLIGGTYVVRKEYVNPYQQQLEMTR